MNTVHTTSKYHTPCNSQAVAKALHRSLEMLCECTHAPLNSTFFYIVSCLCIDGLPFVYYVYRAVPVCFCSEDIFRFIVSKMNGIATLSMFHMARNPWVRRCYAMQRAHGISPASAQFSGAVETASLYCDSWYSSSKLGNQRRHPSNTCYHFPFYPFFPLSLLAPLLFSSVCVRKSQQSISLLGVMLILGSNKLPATGQMLQ